MMVLITYDVETTSLEGRKRLRKVAKICLNFGQRVQNSVFECSVDPGQFVLLKKQIEHTINPQSDNVRFYLLGKNWERKIETLGKDETYNPDTGFLII